MSNTVTDSIVKVLTETKQPLTPSEIYQKIRENGLYDFNSKTPITIIQSALRKNCVGVEIKKSTGKKIFKIVGQGRYTLS